MAKLVVFEVVEPADLKLEAAQRKIRQQSQVKPSKPVRRSRFRDLLENVASYG